MADNRLFKLKSTPLDTEAQAEKLYELYPRKASKGSALTAIRRAMRQASYEVLVDAVAEYARACRAGKKKAEYIPYPATWFNNECWKDDRTDWWRGAETVEAEQTYTRMLAYVRKFGRNSAAPATDAHLYHKAKKAIRACAAGWNGFCDGKVSEAQFLEAWRNLK